MYSFKATFGLYRPSFHSTEKLLLYFLDEEGNECNIHKSFRDKILRKAEDGIYLTTSRYVRVLLSIEGNRIAKYVHNIFLDLQGKDQVSIVSFSGLTSGLSFSASARILLDTELPQSWKHLPLNSARFRPPEHVLRHIVITNRENKDIPRRLIIKGGMK